MFCHAQATCKFTKAESSTSLRVTFQGNMRVIGCSKGCCRRWFLTINGKKFKIGEEVKVI